MLNSLEVAHCLNVHALPIELRLNKSDLLRLLELSDQVAHVVAPTVVCPALQESSRFPSACTLHGYSHLDVLALDIGSDPHYNVLIQGKVDIAFLCCILDSRLIFI